MKKLKYILTITSTSFMFVVLLNAISLSFQPNDSSLSAISIFQIFIICLLIALAIVNLESISFVHNHLVISSYFLMTVIVFTGELLSQRKFNLTSILLEMLCLTVVFLGVWFSIHCVHDYEASQINAKIKERRKRNLK